MFDDLLGSREEEKDEIELQLDSPDLDLNDIGIESDEDVWSNDVDTSNNAEPPDNDDCDDSCDGCGC